MKFIHPKIKWKIQKTLAIHLWCLYNNEKASGVSEMEKKYSNVEFMKAVKGNSSTLHAEKMLNEIYMDMFLNCIHREQTRERIGKLVDDALDKRDEKKFRHYAKQLMKFKEAK